MLSSTAVKPTRLTYEQRDSIFAAAFSDILKKEPTAAAVLDRLAQFSPSAAAGFGLKSEHLKDLAFRLVFPNAECNTDTVPTYITISYR